MLDDRVRKQRAAVETNEADAIYAGIEQSTIDVYLPLENELVRFELARLPLQRRVLSLEARVAPISSR
jgi:hypothetical protein